MSVEAQIKTYIDGQDESKKHDLELLHREIRTLSPGCRLWFLDGKDSEGKVVSNPNIGYGFQVMHYAGGKTRDFYRVGISANKSGISVYILGISDKKYLADKYAKSIGKASVSGYCIKFRKLGDISLDVLKAALRDGFAAAGK